MTNKKYINAEAFKRRVIESAFEANKQDIYDIAKGICEMVDYMESADVAPVVRCGDCVHALKSNKCNPDSRLCDLNYYSGGGRKIVNLDGYCHLGRRKRGENAEHCVCCGDVIPEGRQVCLACETGGTNART